ncbi:MAG: ecotin family protein [Sedimenticolaceae bacterium]|jgi:ecotin
MKIAFAKLLALGLAMVGLSVSAAEHLALEPFPPPREGMERFVIVLPHKERGEEDDFRVEIVVGKQMLTDGVNGVRLGNRIEPRPLQGWGYTYYEVTGPSTTMSTLMAPRPGAPQVDEFVTAAPLRIAYNSRLPVVVYVPRGFEVRYRIWEAPKAMEKAQQG